MERVERIKKVKLIVEGMEWMENIDFPGIDSEYFLDFVVDYVLDHLKGSCKNLYRAAELETPQIEDGIKSENAFEKREIFGSFLGHFLWVVDFFQKYHDARKIEDKMKSFKYLSALFHRTAEYFKNDEKFCLEVALFQNNDVDDVEAAFDTLKKGSEHCPDSVELSSALACVETLRYKQFSENKTEIIRKFQEIIDLALISYADNGFKIKPIEWISQADRAMRRFDSHYHHHQFTSALIQSIAGIDDGKELEKNLEQNSHSEKCYLIHKVQAYPKNKLLCIKAIFHELRYRDDLKFLLKTACEHFPNDVNLRNLIYAESKRNWYEFGAAERLFNIVIADDGWIREIKKIYEKFQSNLKEFKAEKQKLFPQIIDVDPSNEKAVEDVIGAVSSFKRGILIKHFLQDDLVIGEYEIVQKVLTKLLLIEPKDSELYFMRAQAEMKLGNLDHAAETFKAGNLLLEWAQLEEKRGNLLEAKKILECARANIAKEDSWITSILFELRANEKDEAQTLLTQAMEKFPLSGKLWAQAISMEERSTRGKKINGGVKNFRVDDIQLAHVMLAAAKFFVSQGNVEKSRKWFNKIVNEYAYFDDAWICFYKLEKIWGSEESSREVLIRFITQAGEYEAVYIDNYEERIWSKCINQIDYWGLSPEELLKAKVDEIDMNDICC